MLLNEYLKCDVTQLASLIKNRAVSAEEVLNCALTRAHDINTSLNAIVTDCSDFAKQCLAKLHGDEPYFGVPLLVKDLGQPILGIRCTEGSQFFSKNISKITSDLINQLILLGFIPFAKTNTPELGLSYVTESSLLGPCRNPFDINRTPGGSSGGSAAAVAAGIAPIATASDGGGSIRIPAACCGLFGFKPTTGVIPTGPLTDELWSGLAVNFVLTKSLRDLEALFHQLADKSKIDLSANSNKLNIICLDGAFPNVPIAPPYLEAVKTTKELLQQLGYRILEKKIELDLESIGTNVMSLIAADTYSAIKLQELKIGRKVFREELEPVTWEFYQRGRALSAHEYLMAKNRLYQFMRPLHQLITKSDVILSPALAQLPLLIGELKTNDEFELYLQKNTNFSPFTSLFNQAGLPAMTLPVMFHGDLPISIQLGAARGNDLLLFSLANKLCSCFRNTPFLFLPWL